jgi:hypothetical protein
MHRKNILCIKLGIVSSFRYPFWVLNVSPTDKVRCLLATFKDKENSKSRKTKAKSHVQDSPLDYQQISSETLYARKRIIC